MSTRESRPARNRAAETKTWESAVKAEGTAPFRLTSCTRGCPDCAGTGAIARQPCDRRTQWLRRVGYGDLFGRWAA